MESKLKPEVERERAKGNEERLPPVKGKSVFFDLLDSFSYTDSSSSSSRRGRGRGRRGPCWIPSLSVITNNRKPTTSTPSSLKRPLPIPFTNKPNKKPRHDLPKEATTAPPPPKKHHGDVSSGACAVNVNKVRKSIYFTNKPNNNPHTSIYFTNKPNNKPHLSIYFTNKPNKKPRHDLPKEATTAPPPPPPKKPHKPHHGDISSGACAVNANKVRKSIYFTNKPNKKPRHDLPKEATTAPPPPKKPHKPHHGDISSGACAVNANKVRKSIYFTNKPNKKPHHHLPKEAAAAPPPPITAAVKKPKKPHKPHDGDTSSGACAVNSRNLPKAAMAVNVNFKTVTVKKTTPFRAAEKRSEAYRRVPPDFNFKPPRSCHHLIQEDHTFDHWRVLVICMLLNMTTGKQVKKVVEDFFVLCPDAETTTKVDTQQIQNVISTLGLHNKRAHMIKRLSEEYLRPDWTHVTSLHGIGKYAADAYAIFCTGKGVDVRPQDHKLVDYWNYIYGNDTSSDAPM